MTTTQKAGQVMRDVILQGDCLQRLRELPDESVQCVVTSPPYFGLRDYGVDGQIGLEETHDAYVQRLVEVFREVRRMLKKDGVLWLNLGDSYGTDTRNGPQGKTGQRATRTFTAAALPAKNSIGSKQLLGMPWRVAFALQADGWILRSDVIWHKPNCMPESVRDRPTKSHEYLFLFAKSERYFYDAEAIKEPSIRAGEVVLTSPKCLSLGQAKGKGVKPSGNATKPFVVVPARRNKRTVWTIATQPFSEAHFATFPPALVELCILAGSRPGDVVLDPFLGAGTVGLVAKQHGRSYLGIELNTAYIQMAKRRIAEATKPKAKIIKLRQPKTDVKQLSLFA